MPHDASKSTQSPSKPWNDQCQVAKGGHGRHAVLGRWKEEQSANMCKARPDLHIYSVPIEQFCLNPDSNICCQTRDQYWSFAPLASSNYHLFDSEVKMCKMPGKSVTHSAIITAPPIPVSLWGCRVCPKNSKWTQCTWWWSYASQVILCKVNPLKGQSLVATESLVKRSSGAENFLYF